MILCNICGSYYPLFDSACPACGKLPGKVDGFISYAPELAKTDSGFKSEYYENDAHLESSHFWFRARRELIVSTLRDYCPAFCSFLEVGCGTGNILGKIATEFPISRLYGSEILTSGLHFASARLPSIEFIQMDARNIPFINEFDVIGSFDVLEHIKEDEQVLRQIYKALRTDGVVLLTVPQHMWLWSAVDEYSCHVRRYSANELHQKLEDAGFIILRSTSFVSTLLPALILSRLLYKKVSDKADDRAELRIAPWLNALFYKLLSTEMTIIKRNYDFPIGGSRFVVARKP